MNVRSKWANPGAPKRELLSYDPDCGGPCPPAVAFSDVCHVAGLMGMRKKHAKRLDLTVRALLQSSC